MPPPPPIHRRAAPQAVAEGPALVAVHTELQEVRCGSVLSFVIPESWGPSFLISSTVRLFRLVLDCGCGE